MNLILDTGSTNTWVNSRMLGGVFHSKFDERSSSTYHFYPAQLEIHYGRGDVYGFWSYDQVCLDQNNCDPEFNFINVFAEANLKGLNAAGLVGLGNANGYKLDMFVPKMKKVGVLKNAIFSFYINF